MRISIIINRVDIYEEVSKATSYTGAKQTDAEGNSAYNKIWASESEYDILREYLKEACSKLSYILSEWMTEDKSNDELYEIELRFAKNFNYSLIETLKETIKNYLFTYVLAKWYMITNKESAESTMIESAGYIKQIENIMNTRKRPQRYEEDRCEMWFE